MSTFFSLFALLLISNSLIFINPLLFDFIGVVTVFSFSIFTATIISLFLNLFKRYVFVYKALRALLYVLIIGMLIVEILLVVNFDTVFYPTMFNILAETNRNEMWQFLLTYANAETLLYFVVIVIIAILLIKGLPFLLSKMSRSFLRMFVLAGLLVAMLRIGDAMYTFVRYRTGQSVPQYSSVLRLIHSYYIYEKDMRENRRLIENLDNCTITRNEKRCRVMVVVIGESYSKYHSQLYGYDKNTSPYMKERFNREEVFLFEDVLTPINGTTGAVRSILSLGEAFESRYSDYWLFPYVFKKAGYYTLCVDNQHLATNSSNIIDSRELSDKMYDKRNDSFFRYDMQILDYLKLQQGMTGNCLVVLKIKGQHYAYKNQFPEEWSVFDVSDYDNLKLSQDKKQIIADYDNATLYNDYFMNELICALEGDNAVVIYMSDHGEEIYDYRDYMGHGGVPAKIKYQIEIPFMVWMSETYKEKNPHMVFNIRGNVDKPYTTDDVAHLILDMAGIDTPQFDPQRSIANVQFLPKKKRLVMNSVVYEEINE